MTAKRSARVSPKASSWNARVISFAETSQSPLLTRQEKSHLLSADRKENIIRFDPYKCSSVHCLQMICYSEKGWFTFQLYRRNKTRKSTSVCTGTSFAQTTHRSMNANASNTLLNLALKVFFNATMGSATETILSQN